MALLCSLDDAEAEPQALRLLRAGETIVVPTDTVYGVAAAALDAAAVLRLFAVKRRPLSQAIPLLIADVGDLDVVARSVPAAARRLARLWPGALTLVVPAAPQLPPELLAGGDTVAVRLPDHDWLRGLIRALGSPLATTSANVHGQPDPQTAEEAARQIGADVAWIGDGGPTPGPIPSTIVDCTGDALRVLRAGALPWERIEAALAGE
jgi:L-threonylcarbamoyladenylate synthase